VPTVFPVGLIDLLGGFEMHQIKNIVIDLFEVESIKQTQEGLEFKFAHVNATSTARGARFSDLINAVDIETFRDTATRIENECGFRMCY